MKKYMGRTFTESEFFQPTNRIIAILSSNNVWLNTVESGLERDRQTEIFNKTIVRIVRWRAINDTKNNQKVWRYIKGYSVRSYEEWESVSNIINRLMEKSVQSPALISMSPKEVNRLYAAEDERRVFKQKLSKMRTNMKELESTLNEYNNLISDAGTTETDVHKFLIKHKAFWMFGLEYNGIKSKVSFPPGKNYYEFDLMLRRHDDFWDLVELKGPNENLFDRRTSRRSMPNRKLSEAVGQVFTYLYAIDVAGELDVVKPKAYIVIGKKETDRASERRIFSSYLSSVELITHSELHKRGQRLLKHIKKTPS